MRPRHIVGCGYHTFQPLKSCTLTRLYSHTVCTLSTIWGALNTVPYNTVPVHISRALPHISSPVFNLCSLSLTSPLCLPLHCGWLLFFIPVTQTQALLLFTAYKTFPVCFIQAVVAFKFRSFAKFFLLVELFLYILWLACFCAFVSHKAAGARAREIDCSRFRYILHSFPPLVQIL